MIYVDRGPAPPAYTERARVETARLAAFYRAHGARAQERAPYKFDLIRRGGAMDALLNRFNGKCAYCESPIGPGAYADLENFRPKLQYWWLTYEWSNLLPACHR